MVIVVAIMNSEDRDKAESRDKISKTTALSPARQDALFTEPRPK